MYYYSEMPNVVGEFDAESMHQDLESLRADSPELEPLKIITQYVENGAVLPHDIGRGIHWNSSRMARKYPRNQNTSSYLSYIDADTSNRAIDHWHVDTLNNDNRQHKLTEIVVASSNFPTQFLIGRLAITHEGLRKTEQHAFQYWAKDQGAAHVAEALEKGDATIVTFKPGEVVQAPHGTLHRRYLPEDQEGFRYFLRLYPRFSRLHTKPISSRVGK